MRPREAAVVAVAGTGPGADGAGAESSGVARITGTAGYALEAREVLLAVARRTSPPSSSTPRSTRVGAQVRRVHHRSHWRGVSCCPQ